MADFENLLRAFLSPVNDVRRSAVQALETAQAAGGDALPIGLLFALRSSATPDLRTLAAVLLRKVINAEDATKVAQWTRIPEASRAIICTQLLLAVKEEPTDLVRRRVCDTLAEVALQVMADAPWAELWLTVHGLVSAPPPAYSMQEAGLLLCEMLGRYIANSMTEHLSSFRALFHQRLSDAAAPLRIRAAAVRSVGAILVSLSSRHTAADEFVSLIPDVIRCLLDARAARDGENAMTIVGVLVDIADEQAQLFKPCLGDAVRALCGVALDASGGTDNDLRRLCFEVVLSIGGAWGGERASAELTRATPFMSSHRRKRP